MESTTQIFLRVQVEEGDDTDVKGESNIGQYAGRVQIEDFEFKMSTKPQSGPKRGSDKVFTNVDLDPVTVTKVFDKASVRFAALLKSQTVLYEVRITVDQQLEEAHVKEQNAIIVFHLTQARIVDIRLNVTEGSAGAGASIRETIEFSFDNVAVEYYYKKSRDSDYREMSAWFETENKTPH